MGDGVPAAAAPDEWEPAHVLAEEEPTVYRNILLERQKKEGTDFLIPVNGDDCMEDLAGWPRINNVSDEDEICMSQQVWHSLGIGIHPGRWCEAQMGYASSMLNAWLTAPGRIYFEDGGTWFRPAMPPVNFLPPGVGTL